MGQKVSELRATAVRLAIDDIRAKYRAEHDGEEPSTTLQGEWFGVTQQKMSSFSRDKVVGQKLADGVAEHAKTTLDGLVWKYVRGEGAVRAGDIPGWLSASEEARQSAGPAGEAFPWQHAAEVILPIAPREASKEFVYDLVHLLYKYARVSGVIRKVKTR